MASIMCKVDDKQIPLFRIIWVSDLPHFCGHDDCDHEGHYEIRLEQGESVWAPSQEQRDNVITAIETWHKESDRPDGWT
jgi:hypothetical protein